ncbi:MAG: hypothetical protein V4574_21485 [Pseudomonadota bacterium]
MTQKPHARPRAALFIGAALLATPAFAQDAPTQVTPPPVVSTVPQTPAPAPSVTFAPAAPTVQAVPETPTAQTAPREATRTTARRTTTTTRQTTRAPAPAAAAPAPAPEPAAPVAAPVEQPVAITPPVEAPVAAPAQTETTATTTETAPTQTPLWPWLLGGALVVIGVIAALLFRRRREYDEVYEEPYEPATVAVAEPLPVAERTYAPRHEPEIAAFVAPEPVVRSDELGEPLVIAEDAEIVKADADDLADLTAAAPVAHRPWLEFGMRPVRAGTSSDEALVDIELTIANSGDMPAKDVRISTFMLKDGESGDMERLLVERDDSSVPPVTIAAGEGTRVDATLAVRKDELQASGDSFSPVIVADARYTMADGTEGRTSATFRVGLWNGGEGIEPIEIGRPQMHDNVAAEVHGTPEHA